MTIFLITCGIIVYFGALCLLCQFLAAVREQQTRPVETWIALGITTKCKCRAYKQDDKSRSAADPNAVP